MKKSFLILVVALATCFASCKKTTSVLADQSITETPKTIASDWISMPFESITNEDGTSSLQADYLLDGMGAADLSTHYTLVYAMIPQSDLVTYQALPMNISSDEEIVSLDFALNGNKLSITAKSNLPEGQVDASKFQGYKFRLVLVSFADYQVSDVDWTDYTSVANAFHLANSVKAFTRNYIK